MMRSNPLIGHTQFVQANLERKKSMKIDLPKSNNDIIRVWVKSPIGEIVKTLASPHTEVEIEVPDEVHEDEIEVLAVFLGPDNKPVGDVLVLKEAVKPEPASIPDDENPKDAEECYEDALVEAGEEADQSLPDEEVDELSEEEVDHCDGQYELGCS